MSTRKFCDICDAPAIISAEGLTAERNFNYAGTMQVVCVRPFVVGRAYSGERGDADICAKCLREMLLELASKLNVDPLQANHPQLKSP